MAYDKERAVKENQGLVVALAKRFTPRASAFGLEFLDLVQAGNVGLLEACDRFIEGFTVNGKIVKFSTYAYNWVHKFIQKTMAEANLVSIPNNVACARRRVQEASRKHELLCGSPLPKDSRSYFDTLGEMVEYVEGEAASKDNVEDNIIDMQEKIEVRKAFEHLRDREKTVISRRIEGATLSEIAAEMGVTFEFCRQIENAAIANLTKKVKNQSYKSYKKVMTN